MVKVNANRNTKKYFMMIYGYGIQIMKLI